MDEWGRLLSGCRGLNLDRGFESHPPRYLKTAFAHCKRRFFYATIPITRLTKTEPVVMIMLIPLEALNHDSIRSTPGNRRRICYPG